MTWKEEAEEFIGEKCEEYFEGCLTCEIWKLCEKVESEAYKRGKQDQLVDAVTGYEKRVSNAALEKAAQLIDKRRFKSHCTYREFGYHDDNCELGCPQMEEITDEIRKLKT